MSNKKQLHLKTINFGFSVSSTSRFSCSSFSKAKRNSTQTQDRHPIYDKKQITSYAKKNRDYAQMTPSINYDLLGRFNELSINRQSMQVFTKKQFFKQSGAFPKREYCKKQVRPFKYLIHSAIGRKHDGQADFLNEFYKKVKQATAIQLTKPRKSDHRTKRSMTESAVLSVGHPRKTTTIHSTSAQVMKMGLITEPQIFEPWQTSSNSQQNNFALNDL